MSLQRRIGPIFRSSVGDTFNVAYGCPKDFLAEWRCGETEFHTAMLSPEAGAGSTLVLSCVRQTGAGK